MSSDTAFTENVASHQTCGDNRIGNQVCNYNSFDCDTHKYLEMHAWVLSTMTNDVLVLKHQDISSHSADQISIALDQFQTKMSHLWQTTLENKIP